MKKISENSYSIIRKIRKDSKGKYVLIFDKKIRFGKKIDIIPTDTIINEQWYVQDYRAFDGVKVGKSITLQITKRY